MQKASSSSSNTSKLRLGVENEDGTLTVTYKAPFGNYFFVDGDKSKELKVSGSREYVRYCLREKLRKFENGQIKVFEHSGPYGYPHKEKWKRDWECEEIIKERLWEDINSETPIGYCKYEIICNAQVQTESHRRSPSPPNRSCFPS